jgi:hypothetical protein
MWQSAAGIPGIHRSSKMQQPEGAKPNQDSKSKREERPFSTYFAVVGPLPIHIGFIHISGSTSLNRPRAKPPGSLDKVHRPAPAATDTLPRTPA